MKDWKTGAAALALASMACFSPAAGAAEAGTIPVEAFFGNPELTAPLLSPSGDALAMQIVVDGHRVLAVVDTATLKKIVVVARFTDTDVGQARWVNDRRLVFNQQFETEARGRYAWHGLWAVDRDGANLRALIRPDLYRNSETGSHIKDRTLTSEYAFTQTLRDGSNDVIVEQAVFAVSGGSGGAREHAEIRSLVPLRLDTTTGRTTSLVEGAMPARAQDWVIDDQGRIRAVVTSSEGQDTLLAPRDGAWAPLVQYPSYGSSPDALSSLLSAADGSLYALRASDTPERTRSLYRLDPAKGRTDSRPLVLVKGFDFDGTLIEDHCAHKVLGARYSADALGTVWFDPVMKAQQARIDAALPGRVNLVSVAACTAGAPVLVTSTSDRAPPQYFLFGPGDAGLRAAGLARPGIDPRQMAETDFVRIKARDGREFPAYVTRPRGKGPWPAVVLVHGGPNVRGWSWEWDAQSQFLASRGYLVVKPEFRGSDGYGADLLEAGYRQWGLAMQDDIADATRWAIAQGLATPGQACIMGGSYGGYATLMGLARYPELYRCGVAYAAVADIDMMYETWWSDQSDDWKGYGMPVTVGDRVKDAAQFKATSPLQLAARIKQPLLLAHGRQDERVPIEQATAMRDALQANHAPLTWLQYVEEGHGFSLLADRLDFYRRVEAFLAANLGTPASVAAR